MKLLIGTRGFILVSMLCIITLPSVANSGPSEPDVGVSKLKEAKTAFLEETSNDVFMLKSYNIDANIDAAVPKIKHNKIRPKDAGTKLATLATKASPCGCRGSPNNTHTKK